jgi:hypothetical protein
MSSCGFVTARGQTKILHSILAKLSVGAGLVPAQEGRHKGRPYETCFLA